MRRLLPLFGLVLLVGPVRASGQSPPANEDCLACHGDASAERSDGRPVAVLPETYAPSIHGAAGISCVDCHADLAAVSEFPHAETLARVDCSTCHDEAASRHAASVHARARTTGPAAACADCHGAHDILPSADPKSRTYHLNVASTCATCHGPGARASAAGDAAAPKVATQYEDSIHGQALSRRGLLVAPSCVSCHGAHDVLPHTDGGSRVHRDNVVQTCTSCHAGILPAFERGAHAAALAAGHADAPTCASCHTAHDISRTETERWQLDVIAECGTCHIESFRTYRDTFHGKVTALGFSRVAKCADCHGAHDVLPASNPQSAISPERRLETCRQCHANANAKFAAYDPHADADDPSRSPALHYTSLFMKGLLWSVFAFFAIHTLLWFPRSFHTRLARRHDRPPGAAGTEASGDPAGDHAPRGESSPRGPSREETPGAGTPDGKAPED